MSGINKTLGGDRLGSGNKQKVYLHNYERSTHDLSYMFRSSIATGTLVPFMKYVAVPGDNFTINLNADVKTLPTVGPLFGSFKLQLDIFQCPMRLYNAMLHMNAVKIGLNMADIKLPVMEIETHHINANTENVETAQINQSSILAYLGIRGNGYNKSQTVACKRRYNAVPLLAYWDIYKNYYANKQEENGAYLGVGTTINPTHFRIDGGTETAWAQQRSFTLARPSLFEVKGTGLVRNAIEFNIGGKWMPIDDVFQVSEIIGTTYKYSFPFANLEGQIVTSYRVNQALANSMLTVNTFKLDEIDKMRIALLKHVQTSPFRLSATTEMSGNYKVLFNKDNILKSQIGLGLKTYQSDIFNNWLNTEWIDGSNMINEISSVDTSGGSFNIETLILSKKVYDMLNRIAVSGGTYEDWLQAVYAHEPHRRAESPIYLGGLSKEVVFQEVISTAETEKNPLATLAGRGRMTDKHKGGYIDVRVDEPSYIIGIVSLTPRIDYSQGNDWDTGLTSINDLHKPGLDGIGFQDLITTQMAFWESQELTPGKITTYSAGKTPAWINYMTAYNKNYGEFANSKTQMFMTLNRRYEMDKETFRIKDLTTYIDPVKYNYIFADTRLDAQNFWLQIGCDVTARRKMSAKVMPNL